jgi:dienelactone hydrolase
MSASTIDQHTRHYPTTPAAFAFQAQTLEALHSWQIAFRKELTRALGLEHMQRELPEYHPQAELLGSEPMQGYSRERWVAWVEPDVTLPFYLLRPNDKPGLLPLVLTPHGHNSPHLYLGIGENDEERQSILEGERDIAVQAVQEGYLTLAPTVRGFGETRSAADIQAGKLSSCRTQLLNGLLIGRTPIGERVWDISRLLDWALANQPVDPQRIAITGNSGGGTVSLFAAACDERISVAVPGSYFCTFAASIGSIDHCECNYVPGILLLGEMYDVAGLIAPRPFRALAGELDDIFPISAARYAFEKLQRVYQVAGKPDHCSLYVGKGGHRYYKDGAWEFIRTHFQ